MRHLTLRDLSLSSGGSALQFMDADGAAVSFKRDVTDYNVRVVLGTRELTLNGTLRSVLSEGNPNSGGYTVLVNGEPPTNTAWTNLVAAAVLSSSGALFPQPNSESSIITTRIPTASFFILVSLSSLY